MSRSSRHGYDNSPAVLLCLDFETSGQRLQIVLCCLIIEGKEHLRSTEPSLCMYIPAHEYRMFMLLLKFP